MSHENTRAQVGMRVPWTSNKAIRPLCLASRTLLEKWCRAQKKHYVTLLRAVTNAMMNRVGSCDTLHEFKKSWLT
jgi:hypothetical protein